MKHLRFPLFHPLWPAVILLTGLMLAMSMTSAGALPDSPESPSDDPGGIEGTLLTPLEAPVAHGWIDIQDEQGQPWMGTDTDAGGYFQMSNLPAGIYVLTAYPPPESPFAASVPVMVEVLGGQWVAKNLHLTVVRISGWVQDSDSGGRIEGATVIAHDDDWTIERWDVTNPNGEYKIGGVEIGVTYTLEALPPEGTEYRPLPIHYTAVPTATDVVLEMAIPPLNVTGIVHNPDGMAVPGAGVVVWNEFFWEETATDVTGTFEFRGLPPGEFWLQSAPPWGPQGAGLIASPPLTFTLPFTPPDTLVDVGVITLPRAFKTVKGKVLDSETGGGVPDALIVAHRLDRPGYSDLLVAPSGAFTLGLPGGEWLLSAEPFAPSPSSPPPEWIFPGPPAWVPFIQPVTATEEITGVVLEVIPTNAWVNGRVICPPADPPCPPPEAIQVELRSEQLRNGSGVGGAPPEYPFEIPIRDGWYELVIHVDSPWWQGPEPEPVFVGPGARYDAGDIPLLIKDARITGKVRGELGMGIPFVPVVAWRPEGFGSGWAETDASGIYTMQVIGGEWFVEPQPVPEMPFVFRHKSKLVRVAPGGTMAGVDLELTKAEARIKGSAVDAHSGERLLGLDGWTWAEQEVSTDTWEFFSEAPMWDGGFQLKAKGDNTYVVGVEVPAHASYVSGRAGPVGIPLGAEVPVSVPLEHKDALIEGGLIVPGTPPTPAHGVWAEVFGEDEQGHWVVAQVDRDSAGYGLGVISGTWHLRAWVDPESGYAAPPTATVVTVQAGQFLPFTDFEVWPIEASISGQVLQPNGDPISGTFVFAEGDSPHVGRFEAHAETDNLGNFELLVPEGGYMVGAGLPGEELAALGWLNPPPVDVPWVSAPAPISGVELRFVALDGEINGSISFASDLLVTATHPAYVWGWADTGAWAETEATPISGTNTFTYTLHVISDTTWHVGAVYEDWNNGTFYESKEETIKVPAVSGQATQNLELGGPWMLPQPLIMSFDGSYMQTIIMPDGVELRIPAGAIVKKGTVTLFVFPTQEMRPEPGQEIIGAGYEIWAVDENGLEITQFNQNVVMTFHYASDAVLEGKGISEQLLVPVYYSTLVGKWILADSYVVDTVNNEIKLHVNHFSKFGVFSTEAGKTRVYLPLVLRQ